MAILVSAPAGRGALTRVDGKAVHVVVEGGPGPVVVLESGLGGGVLEWGVVAAGLVGSARVVRRDRPGLGRSEPQPGKQTATAAARDLKCLLERLGLPGPYVLVGHSLGGLHVRAFAALFPEDVAGVVLVDPSHEDAVHRSRTLRRVMRLQAAVTGALLRGGPAGRALFHAVYTRALASECAKPLDAASAEILRRSAQQCRAPSVLATVGAETAGLDRSFEQLRELRRTTAFPAVPLRVISQARPRSSRTMNATMRVWQDLHAELLELSPDSAHLLAERSGHLVPLEQPELVVHAVMDVLGSLQHDTPSPRSSA